MENLQNYVDKLFKKYKNTPEIESLKEKTLKTLIAKQISYQEQGLDKEAATEKAKTAIVEIDNLIPGNIKVCKNQYNLVFLQKITFSLLIGWIFMLPCNLISEGLMIQSIILWGLLISGLAYLWLRSKKKEAFWNETTYYSKNKAVLLKKYAWYIYFLIALITIIWGFYNILFSTLNNIDFHTITYIIYHYFSPLILIVYPIGIGNIVKLLEKTEHKINPKLEFISLLFLIMITIFLYLL